MIHWALLRVAANLKRIATALETANDISRERMQREFPPTPRPSRPIEISHPSVEDWNKRYYKEHNEP
jgi:hypothetical protein